MRLWCGDRDYELSPGMRPGLVRSLQSLASTSFTDHRGEALAAEGEGGLNLSSHSYPRALARNSAALAIHPDLPCAVVDLIHARAQSAKRLADSPANSDFFICITPGIINDVGNIALLRTSYQHQNGDRDCKYSSHTAARV